MDERGGRGERLSTDEVERDVDPAVAADEPGHAVTETGTVGHRIGTEGAHEVCVALARRAQHPGGAELAGHLHRQVAHTAGRGVHQDRVALPGARGAQGL